MPHLTNEEISTMTYNLWDLGITEDEKIEFESKHKEAQQKYVLESE